MEAWRIVWREGFAPGLSVAGLRALRDALASDDPRLQQGRTTDPPPLTCVQEWPCEGACAVGFAGWRGEKLETIGQVEEYFARLCYDADIRVREQAACRHFLNWFDEAPRDVMRAELIAEIDLALSGRTDATPPAPVVADDCFAGVALAAA